MGPLTLKDLSFDAAPFVLPVAQEKKTDPLLASFVALRQLRGTCDNLQAANKHS